jgi:hypothetical protein
VPGKPFANHPFVDGNKRAAFAVTYTFLTLNGFNTRRCTSRRPATPAPGRTGVQKNGIFRLKF